MTANADTFVGWLLVGAVFIYAAANRLVVLMCWLDRRNEERDVADAVALSETPIFDGLFADQVLADIDSLPEVRRAR